MAIRGCGPYFLCYYRNLVGETSLPNVVVLFVDSSLGSGKYFVQIATLRMELSIICFKGSQVDRVPTVREKSVKNEKSSRSGKSQGNLS